MAADEVAATYTANGRQETLTDGAGNRTTFVYDGHDRAVRMRYPSLAQGAGTSSTTDYEELTYDAGGNVVTQRLRDGTSIGYTYDALNRVTAKDLPGTEPTVSYGYDLLGQLTSASAYGGQTLTFTYDALGRRLTEAGPLATVTNAYDLAGRRTALTSSNSYVIGYDHRVTGELSAVRDGGGAVVVGYGYDGLGRRTSLTRDNGAVTSWGYDAAGRLATLTDDAAGAAHDRAVTFSYNPAGQIVGRSDSNDAFAFTALANQGVTDSHNGLNQVTATGSTSVSHDARGNTSAIGANAYGYDSENHLTSGPGGATLSYDPLGRLYQVTAGTTNRRFLYDGDQVMSVYGSSGNVTEFPVHGEEPNSPLLTYDNSGRAWSHPDERGSVVARSNDAGTVTAVNRYDEYGAPQGGSVAGLFGYTGQAWLPELGMYDYHARVYSPDSGRFMQTDPLGYEAGMNIYAYVSGDPVNLDDPTGLADEDDAIIVTGQCDPQCQLERARQASILQALDAAKAAVPGLGVTEDAIVVTGQRIRRVRTRSTRAAGVRVITDARQAVDSIGAQLRRMRPRLGPDGRVRIPLPPCGGDEDVASASGVGVVGMAGGAATHSVRYAFALSAAERPALAGFAAEAKAFLGDAAVIGLGISIALYLYDRLNERTISRRVNRYMTGNICE